MQQAKAVGNQLAGVIDPVKLVECIGQEAGAEIGANRTVSALAGGAFQQFGYQRFGHADLTADHIGGQACRFRDQRHVVAAILRRYRMNVEQAAGIGIASRRVIGDGQCRQQHIAQERVFHRRIAHRLQQADGTLAVVILYGDGRVDHWQAAGQFRMLAQVAGL
ncbi:hypothetical protein D3C71_1560370 [compost metagenome]